MTSVERDLGNLPDMDFDSPRRHSPFHHSASKLLNIDPHPRNNSEDELESFPTSITTPQQRTSPTKQIDSKDSILRKGSFSEKDREGLLSLRNSNNDKKTQNNSLQRSPSGIILVGSTPVTPTTTPNDLTVTRNVHFVCPFEGIEVKLAGTFNGWTPIPMKRDDFGRFSVDLPLLPGTHQFKFIVDGRWMHDPQKPFATDQHGNVNNIAKII